ncbi:TraK family protein [Nitrincola alkalilacustris]|uniref:TraK family protein n=1 Tax=Nitrincola alkalilacustris TaxID=1571224 RepID=UPI00124D89BD|nr:TraK family protein [Nitrincola alkalilacustris]
MELIEELRIARLNKPPTNGKVAFLKNIDQIKIALDQGYTAVDVWRVLHTNGEIKINYNQFALYVRRFIRGCDQ